MAAMTIRPISPPPPAFHRESGCHRAPSPGIDDAAAALTAPVLDATGVGAADLRHLAAAPFRAVRLRSRDQPRIPTAPAPISGAVAETGRRDPRLPTVRQAGVRAELLLGGVEERRREPEGDAAADDDEVEVEQVAQRRRRSPDEAPGALHDLVGRLGRRPTGDRLDRQARRLGLEAAAGAAAAPPAVGVDDDVADVAGVGRRAVEQLAVEHDAAADRRRHGDHAVVVVTLGRAHPALGQRQRLAVEVAVHPLGRQLAQPLAERELAPRREVDGRHRLAVGRDRARRTRRRRRRRAARGGRRAPSAARRSWRGWRSAPPGRRRVRRPPPSGRRARPSSSPARPRTSCRRCRSPGSPGPAAGAARAARSARRGTSPDLGVLRDRLQSHATAASSTRLIW